jgi:hypothetical protein
MNTHDLALKCTTKMARGSGHPAPRVLESTRNWVNIPTKYIDSLESIMLHLSTLFKIIVLDQDRALARLSISILNLVNP